MTAAVDLFAGDGTLVVHADTLAAGLTEIVGRLDPAPVPCERRPPRPLRRGPLRPGIHRPRVDPPPKPASVVVTAAVLTIYRDLYKLLEARTAEVCEACGCLCFAWEPCPQCRWLRESQ